MPSLPDPHAIAVIILTLFAFYLFSREIVTLETTALIVLVALSVGFQLFPYERNGITVTPADFYLGFGHEALVTICALMILGRGLVVTGALEPVARWFSRLASSWPQTSMLVLLVFCAAASGVVNDTPIVVLMMPILVSVALRTKTSPAKSLLSMNYSVLIGGMSTAIGTSTNLLVVAIAADLGMRHLGIFDFTPMAALAAVGGLLYVWLVLPRLLPDRTSLMADTSPRIFSAVLHVKEDGFANGKTLSEILEKTDNRMKLDRVERGEQMTLARLPTAKLNAGDRLFVSDTPENLKEFETLLGATLHNVDELEEPIGDEHPLTASGQQLAEVVVTEASMLHQTTLRRTRFSDFYNVIILALHRSNLREVVKMSDIGDVFLRVGDVLLVQGSEEAIKNLRENAGLLVLGKTTDLPHTSKAPIALAIMAVAVTAAALKLVPISISALFGVLAMLLTRCLDWKDVGSSLSTKVVMLVVSSLALGAALTFTGGTDYIAQVFLVAAKDLSPEMLLGLLMLLMALLTNFVSNNAAAAIGTPIAMSIAQNLGVSPEPFVLAIMFGANFCYATPMAYQTNLMVMSAGGYQFSDFVKAGVPLTLIMLTIYTFLLPRFFPL
ncbi:MAG: SLC13 family permease [Sulfuricaulis sp.]|uniref:SLC13 family permease n=1 Tax=Sulfuricaulis sp. TaxID=2003553 RepID=UPI0034A563FE